MYNKVNDEFVFKYANKFLKVLNSKFYENLHFNTKGLVFFVWGKAMCICTDYRHTGEYL